MRHIALGCKLRVKPVKQFFNQLQRFKPLPEQPDRLRIGHPIFQLQSQKTHEGQPIAHWVFNPFVGQVIQVLKYQHLEHEHDIDRLGSRLALPFLLIHPR